MFFFLLAHVTHRIRVEKHSASLSEPQSPVNTIDVLANSEEIGSFNLSFGNKETKLRNHNASVFNLKMTELKLKLSQRPDFPSLSHHFLMRCAMSIYRPQVSWTDLAQTPAAVIRGGFENRKPLSL